MLGLEAAAPWAWVTVGQARLVCCYDVERKDADFYGI